MSTRYAILIIALAAVSLAPTTSAQISTQSVVTQPPPQSPLKVRGGSMTFYTKDSWQPSSHDPANQPYCTFIDTSYVDVVFFTGNNFGDFPLYNLSPNWTITIYGREKNGSDLSSRGVKVTAGMGCFNHDTGRSSVTIEHVGNSEFYDHDLPPDTIYQDNRRFHDKGCLGTDTDLEACERIKKVEIRIPTRPHSPYTFICNGECGVDVGVPR